MPSTITFTGAKELEAALNVVAKGMVTEAAAALYQEAEGMMTEAKQRTPVDTGALRASGHVTARQESDSAVAVVLAFGTDYGIYVHEDLSKRHPTGQAKFLESVLMEHAPQLAERVAARVKAAIGA